MDRLKLERPGEVHPDEATAELEMLHEQGIEHEKLFLQELLTENGNIIDLTESPNSIDRTLQAMNRGESVVYQGALKLAPFAGLPDFLIRIEEASGEWPWSYEVWDTKLAKHPKPYFLIQLCCYAEMLEAVQGKRPQMIHVVLGRRADGKALRKSYRTDDFFYFYQSIKSAFLAQQEAFDADVFPEIPAMTDLGRWTGFAERLLADRDDLSRVANIRRSHIKKLQSAGIETVTQLARSSVSHLPKLNQDTFNRLRQQAQLQVESLGKEHPEYQILPACENPCVGLASLPPPSQHDIFFDMEGYPLIDDGREYLFGAYAGDDDGFHFYDWWAHSPSEEKEAFQSFVGWAVGRWKADRSLRIYHYNHYEVTALTRLAGRYGVCEEEVDELLRNHVFVDLFRIVRQSILIGEPSYSLKYVEHLYRLSRQGDVASAGESMVFYQRWLIERDGDTAATSTLLRHIRDYNEQDCISTSELAAWLRHRQEESGIVYVEPEPPPPPDQREAQLQTHALSIEILSSEKPGESKEDRRVRELLGHTVEFHWRNEKPIWRRRFERQTAEQAELIEDRECLAGLERTTTAPVRVKRSQEYEFRFSTNQETKLREGDDFRFAHDWKQTGSITRLDSDEGLIGLKISGPMREWSGRLGITPDEATLKERIQPAVERVVSRWWRGGGLPSALQDLLYRQRPRLSNSKTGPIVTSVDPADIVRVVEAMEDTCLCVQGPPGCGKTYTAARVIANLVVNGKRVAVTSNSHKAINLVLCEVEKLIRHSSPSVSIAKIGEGKDAEGLPESVTRYKNGAEFYQNGHESFVGGTAYALCHASAGEHPFDYLFVDEASQVAVANLVAMCECSRNIVLLGDQMQLGQPAQGSHPGESGLSTLEYLLAGKATIDADFGIFLPKTYRLHPDLCRFISGAVYEDRLQPHESTVSRTLDLGNDRPSWLRRAAGLIHIPVDHDGNTYESLEEETKIADIVAELLKVGLNDVMGRSRLLTPDDILIVAPYNLQVNRLLRRFPPIRVGTIDRFQGQEAPIVILSMCSSTCDASPRGIEFLFSANRLNVAISRAQTLTIIVGSSSLVRPGSASIEHMRLLNIYCRAIRHAEALSVVRGGN